MTIPDGILSPPEKAALEKEKNEQNVRFFKFTIVLYPFIYLILQSTAFAGNGKILYLSIGFSIASGLLSIFIKTENVKKLISFLLPLNYALFLAGIYFIIISDPLNIEAIYTLTGVSVLMILILTFRTHIYSMFFIYSPLMFIHNWMLTVSNSNMSIAIQTNLLLFLSFVVSLALVIIKTKTTIEIIRLKREKWLINNDLKIANAVQESLFPKEISFPGRINYEVFRKAHNQIGGDFYDFVQLREGNLGIFFTDVAGHGISASMVAAILKVVVSTIPYRMKLEPDQLLGFIDEVLQRDLNNYHASAVYLYLDFINKKIKLGNAGHPYVIRSRSQKDFEQLVTKGVLMGFGMRKPIVDVMEIPVEKGDRYVIYTDGLIESENYQGQTLGEGGLINILNLHKDENLPALKKSLLADFESFFGSKKYADDVMLLIFEIL